MTMTWFALAAGVVLFAYFKIRRRRLTRNTESS